MHAVVLKTALSGEIRPDRGETLRYLGFGGTKPDADTLRLIDSCERELMPLLQGRACWMSVPVTFPAPYTAELGFGPVESVSLSKHLAGCRSAFLFAATLGIGADRLIARYQRLSPSRAVVIDALASSAIEAWCDTAERELLQGEEKHCRRFSPGYGDFSLEHQKDFGRMLSLSVRLGVSFTDSMLMLPSKSVTAVIGIGASSGTCGTKCMLCDKKNCIYREVLL